MAVLLLVNLAAVWQSMQVATTLTTMLRVVTRFVLPPVNDGADDGPSLEPDPSASSAQSGKPRFDYTLAG